MSKAAKLSQAAEAIREALQGGQTVPRKHLVQAVARRVGATPRTVESALPRALEAFGDDIEVIPLAGRGGPVAYRLSAKRAPAPTGQPAPASAHFGDTDAQGHHPAALLPKEPQAQGQGAGGNPAPDDGLFTEAEDLERARLKKALMGRARGRLSPEDLARLEANLRVLSLEQLQQLASGAKQKEVRSA